MLRIAPYKKVYKHNLGPICREHKSIYIRELDHPYGKHYFRHIYTDGSWWSYLYEGIEGGSIEAITIEGGPGQYTPVWINPQTNLTEWNM